MNRQLGSAKYVGRENGISATGCQGMERARDELETEHPKAASAEPISSEESADDDENSASPYLNQRWFSKRQWQSRTVPLPSETAVQAS